MTTSSDEFWRALEVLAVSPEGCTQALLMAHGIRPALITELIDAEFARAKTERLFVDGRRVRVTRLRITEIGRAVLAASRKVLD